MNVNRTNNKKKILILIFAFNAEKTIVSLLQRIQKSILNSSSGHEYEVLIIDDCSADNTFQVRAAWANAQTTLNLKLLRNTINQGRGGSQKLGYHYAIIHDFDAVLVLDGNGQYPPEVIKDLVEPIIDGRADITTGFYQYSNDNNNIKNKILTKILTWIQNKILGANLSSYQSYFRCYNINVLKNIPFERNTNQPHFDTQIIIQCLRKNLIIKEIPIAKHYADDCNGNGNENSISNLREILITTILSKLHEMSILYQREYDLDYEKNGIFYDLKLNYKSSHTYAIDAVLKKDEQFSSACLRVLDLGCHQGQLAAELKRKNPNIYVLGVDRGIATNEAWLNLDDFKQIDLNHHMENIPSNFEFDYIWALDIIEHLDNPEQFLDQIRKSSANKTPTVILTTANVAFFIIRMQLLLGSLNYGKQGILDMTHKRLFTFKSLRKMLLQCGYKIKNTKGIPAPFPKAFRNKYLSKTLLKINELLIHISPSLFAYQIFMEVTPLPTVDELLRYAIKENNNGK
ncbi:MAG: glycosyltransferase [Oligoflexia bacterium]|nr:glycosyltransferase [Oligoflexia bacterium]